MFVQDLLRKREHLEKLIDRLGVVGDFFELYVFTNEVNEIEDGMIATAHDLMHRHGSSNSTNEYVLQQARFLLARARSDRATIPHDSLGHCRDALDKDEIPAIREDRERYPRVAPKEMRLAYRARVGEAILKHIDANVDLTGYTFAEAARCLIDAALRRSSMTYVEERIDYMPGMMARLKEEERAFLDRELRGPARQ